MKINQTLTDARVVRFPVEVVRQRNDITIVSAIARGDRSAMQALYCRYRIPLYRFSLRLLHDPAAAEDIVSELFLHVWRRAAEYDGRARVSTWLFAIARNLALSALRRRPAQELSTSIVETFEDSADSPEWTLHHNQQRSMLAHCLTQLSAQHREVIDLVYYHGKSVREASEIIGIPQATVKTRMHYARKEIAYLLDRHQGATRDVNRQRENVHAYSGGKSRVS
jgi:RNA polymerase sigma-70 factor (ECF subfamily)